MNTEWTRDELENMSSELLIQIILEHQKLIDDMEKEYGYGEDY